MADFGLSSPFQQKKQTTNSFLFGFTAFTSKTLSDTEPVMSPTSILDTKPFLTLKNPFWTDSNSPKPNPKNPSFDTKPGNGCHKFDAGGIGLGIIDSLTDDTEKLAVAKKPEYSKFLLFGSQLKIQIPAPNAGFPAEFGIKTKNSHLVHLSPSKSVVKWSSNGSISTVEMELSEEYTCVISRGGPVTTKTRIYDNCVVDSCSATKDSASGLTDVQIGFPSETFLSFCHACRKNLDHGNDIYMYRGEKAFCSEECRQEGILVEESVKDSGSWSLSSVKIKKAYCWVGFANKDTGNLINATEPACKFFFK